MAERIENASIKSSGVPGDGESLRVPVYPRRSLFTVAAFLAFVAARYVQVGARMGVLGTIRFELILGVFVCILVGVELGQRAPDISGGRRVVYAILALFAAMVIQLPLAAAGQYAIDMFVDRVIKFALMTFFMVVMIESPKSLRLFLATFLFSVFYITQESVQGLLSGGLVWENQGIPRLHGAVPIYMHPNSLGGVSMGALPFTVFFFPRVKKLWLRLFLVALTVTSLVCVIYSGSRTAYLGLLAFVWWWYFQSTRKIRWVTWGLIGSVVAVAILPPEYIERFKSIGGQEKEGRSKEARIVILEDAWTIFIENPIGVGVASFPVVRYERFGRMQDTHNLYLEVGTNLGVQGLVIFLGLVMAMMLEFRRTALGFREQRIRLARSVLAGGRPPPMRRAIAAHVDDLHFLEATAQATAGFILVRLVLGLFGMDLYEVYWWFGAGIAIVLAGLLTTTRRRSLALSDTVPTATVGSGF